MNEELQLPLGGCVCVWEEGCVCVCVPTVLDVQDVVFVQGPAPHVGGVQLIALEYCSPLLPQDQVQTRLVL